MTRKDLDTIFNIIFESTYGCAKVPKDHYQYLDNPKPPQTEPFVIAASFDCTINPGSITDTYFTLDEFLEEIKQEVIKLKG